MEATHEAGRIMEEATAQAQQILAQSIDQAADARAQGYEEGRRQGAAEYAQRITKGILRLRTLEDNLEADYIGLLKVCVEKILGQELRQSPEAVLSVVRSTLREAHQPQEVLVRAHPEDIEILRRNQAGMLEVLTRASAVKLRPDLGVSRGGCMVTTELGTIDGTLEQQISALVEAVEAELSLPRRAVAEESLRLNRGKEVAREG